MSKLESLIRTWPFAVVHLRAKDGTQSLSAPAAFVFETPDGFAFIEPGYLDPHNASNRLHRIVCALRDVVPEDVAVLFDGPVWEGHLERYTGAAAQRERVSETLDWFQGALVPMAGRTVDEERESLRGSLRAELS